MKKSPLIFIALLALLGAKCGKDGSAAADGETPLSAGAGVDLGLEFASQELVDAAFKLDFTPLEPEKESEADLLPPEARGGSSPVFALPAGLSAPGGQTVGGGLRKELGDYKTEYFNPEREAARISAIQEAQAKAGSGGSLEAASSRPLTVADWGPRGFFSSAVQRPSIYVVFSEPMIPLAALGAQSGTSPLVSISPPLKGTFRWYGTSLLSFEAEEPCQAQQNYRIEVNPQTVSLSGKKISGETSFAFFTETLRLTRIEPGEEFRRRNNFYFDDDMVPPEAAGSVSLYFNYPVSAGDLRPYLEVGAGGNRNFTLVQGEERKIVLQIEGKIGFETEIRITLKKGAKSANSTLGTPEDSVFSYSTPGPFRVTDTVTVPLGRYRNQLNLHFSERIKAAGAAGRIRTDPPMDIGPDNLEISGALLTLYNLPVNYGDRYRLTLDPALEDIYGRKLEPYTAEIRVPGEPPPRGSVNFLDPYREQGMLEARFDPRYLFEYRNVGPDSWYTLSTVKNPFFRVEENTRRFTLNTQPNRRWFADMDLKPYLNQEKYGFVVFDAKVDRLTAQYQSASQSFTTGISTAKNKLTLQVTDLGITVRSGFNRTVVMVTSLSTGEPVENALVRLISPGDISIKPDIAQVRSFAEGRTDSRGLALFNFNAGVFNGESSGNGSTYGYRNVIYVHAEKDGDQAVFQPAGHNTWPFNVYSAGTDRGEAVQPVTFMFTDRGLYKPGEILSFRGVDRSQAVGNYLVYRGKYTVTLESDSYRDEGRTVAVLEGETSEAGGFYGTITLPDDLGPDSYRLSYRREGKTESSGSIPVTVAFFERLKFESAIIPPAETLYTGDTVTMSLKASYLAGGSLGGASYEESWYQDMTWFSPPSREGRGYRFGPAGAWEGRRSLSSGRGILKADGTAALSQKSAEAATTGVPYTYTVETTVTDLSNQTISASQSVTVHPARFYLGLSLQRIRGFPKTGQELSFDFLALTPSGEASVPSDWSTQGEDAGRIRVEFLREEWHLAQQEGVAGYVYDQYVKETIIEGAQSIRLGPSGSFKFTPSKPGYYTARLSARDSRGKKVLTEYSFYVTGQGASGYWNMNRSDEIRLTPDQGVYNPGDTAQILLQSALPRGNYLITVEREGIYSEELKYLEEGTTVLEVPIARNYVPVVYVSVASYSVRSGPPTHEYGASDTDLPRGYYGVTALQVNPRVKAFTVTIEDGGKRVYRPGETVSLTLKAEKNGRPLSGAELTLMAVDRGVLDLVNYHVSNPLDYFYGSWRFPLSVQGGDSRSLLINPVTYSIKNLAGGDKGDEAGGERSDFNPTAVFEPMLKTGDDGKVKVSFNLPDNLTTYRLTVFGVQGDLFALKESEIAARNIINVKEVLPRRLRERDTGEVGVLITNMDGARHRVQVSLGVSPGSGSTNNGLVKQPGTALVDGVTEQSIDLKAGENGVVYFDLAAVKEGYVNLNFTIRSGVFNEKLINELYIERPYVMETFTTLGSVGAEEASAREALVIPGWADNGVGSLSVSLDGTRLGLLDSAVDYLFHYPYGCLEQRSAAVMPLIIFGDYIDAFGLKSTVSNPRQVVESEIKSWARYQMPGGGFPYWPGGEYTNPYVSLRIAHILALAKEKNIAIPESINIEKLVSYLNDSFRGTGWNYGYQSYIQAYMLYVFSLLGIKVEPSRLAEIAARQNVDAGTLSLVGMSYRNIKRNAEAAAAGEKIRNLIRSTTRGADLTDPREKDSLFYYSFYGNKLEQLALTLEFFVRQYPGDPVNGRLLHTLLSQKKAGGYWDSTAVTVRVLSAVDALIRAENLEQLNVEGGISLSGTELFKDRYRGLGAKPSGKSFDFKAPPLSAMGRDTTLPLTVTRNGRGALYYTASLRYAIPPELQSYRDEGLGVFVSCHDADTGREIPGSALQSGKTYQARVRLSTGRDRTYVALRVPLPSGAEVLDTTFVTTARYNASGGGYDDEDYDGYYDDYEDHGEYLRYPSNMTILDNEVRYFWDSFSKGEAAVQFLFRAARRGVYPTPPVQAECMYEGEIFGRSRGMLYTIE
jgi:uncharacterized protein YfaS (alpha-2-macroglobulin family)